MNKWLPVVAIIACLIEPAEPARAADPVDQAAATRVPGRKVGDDAGSCIPMQSGQKGAGAAGTSIAAGQKRGDVTAGCEPMTRGRKGGEAAGGCISFRGRAKVVETLPGGVKLLAMEENGVLVGYSAIDGRGKPLKVRVSRDPLPDLRSDPGDRVLQRKQERDERRRKLLERAREALDEDQREEKGCYIYFFSADGVAIGAVYGECPKGAS